ncbi:MAG: dienelactone hydrolase family protein [Phycisphaerales bacterium]|nr:dienelactone hydrolase family protein [Phycisphaerales bacterium]
MLGRVVAMVLAGFASVAVGQDLSQPGPFAAGFRQVSVSRPDTSTFTARLFYPATSAGQNAPLDASAAPFPAVSFGHGFFQAVPNYQSTLSHLATHGYLVIATDSQGGLFPSHSAFAADMLLCLGWLEQQNADPGSALYGVVNTQAFGLSGHSMGGGASILAADDPRVRAVAPLAAANTSPSAIDAADECLVPVRHIVGSADSIVSANSTRQIFANSWRPRQFVSLQGGFHCGFIDAQGFGCDSGSMTRADQLARTRRLLTEFFDLYLKGDQQRWETVWMPDAQTDPRVLVTLEPDSGLSPTDSALVVRAGRRASVSMTLTNLGPQASGFEMLSLGAGWMEVMPGVVGPLATGSAGDLEVWVRPPLNTVPGTHDHLVTARSQRDGGTRSFARINVTVVCGPDLNEDGVLDFFDIQEFLANFAGGAAEADVNDDRQFNFFDVQIFLDAFSRGC